MENVFGSLNVYGERWEKVGERKFNADEISAVREAKVVPSDWGLSVCFFMKAGGTTYIPVSKQGNQPTVGDVVDMNAVSLITVSRSGDGERLRVEF